MWRSCLAIAAALAASLWCGAEASAQEGGRTVIEGGYDFVADRLTPEPRAGVRTKQSFRIELSGGNAIDETWESRNARGRRPIERRRARVLGGDGEGRTQWRVAGPSRLVRIADLPQSITTLTVSVRPDKSCVLSVAYRLKPGFQEYRYRRRVDRTWALFVNPRAENLSCTIR